jgi:serine/threonine protein kinase
MLTSALIGRSDEHTYIGCHNCCCCAGPPYHLPHRSVKTARFADAVGLMTSTTLLQVTHMPPELLSEGRLSKAADVYSFGVMLWEM